MLKYDDCVIQSLLDACQSYDFDLITQKLSDALHNSNYTHRERRFIVSSLISFVTAQGVQIAFDELEKESATHE